MPELPEVETIRRGISPHLIGHRIVTCQVGDKPLRAGVPMFEDLPAQLCGHTIEEIQRRGKYLIFMLGRGGLIIHLGMSGVLKLLDKETAWGEHDHLNLQMSHGISLRYHDPRRFGAIVWHEGRYPADNDPLLTDMGAEPLEEIFTADYLYRRCASSRVAIKSLLMEGRIVAGIGNIYASESLFRAGIYPLQPANSIPMAGYQQLVISIKEVLQEAIEAGGTTLKDFFHPSGKPGYFAQKLQVYHREGEPCFRCQTPIRQVRLQNRATFFCPRCQTAFQQNTLF